MTFALAVQGESSERAVGIADTLTAQSATTTFRE